ncbi:siderophore enterobactin receptor PfeA [Pigmentiphaga soli]|uniref:Siderophore enterobactin receptor PfeA n=1 Tax=Pigmentiphaga soli TaxID=1007095 RepID=A0ABP8H0A7_9BURK
MSRSRRSSPLSCRGPALLAAGLAGAGFGAQAQTPAQPAPAAELAPVTVTAEEELKQSLGVSVITAEDLAQRPPVNDISEILRTMPGVNLTGNSASGQRGNNRQIDIRGMGPENTLILIDGKPVTSRNSVRYGWRGERDSRGDTNWVPADQIERIEVLRGPAAARYGNGAAGGVVNIITKKPGDRIGGSATVYFNMPQHSEEGNTKRMSFGLNGPLSDRLSFRLYGNVAKTDADAFDINKDHASTRLGANAASFPAGREGVRNRDLDGTLTWKLLPGQEVDFGASYSRQGNIYAGDTQNTNTNAEVQRQLGSETNRLYRQAYSITHRGHWNDATDTLAYLQYERTRNTRLLEGLAGGTEGAFNDPTNPAIADGGFGDIDLRTVTAHAELNRRFKLGGVDQVGTFGLEWVQSKLEDNASDLKARNPQAQVPAPPTPYQPTAKAQIFSAFAEDNIYLTDRLTATPGLRFDHHDQYGPNWSPALNLSYALTSAWTIKGGVARAYKAPNLYQGNTGYTLYSAGNGCWGGLAGCFLMGNDDLKPETSINKEIGVQYARGGLLGSLAYFRNDYRNKVDAGHDVVGTQAGRAVFQWENVPKAVTEGLEGNLTLPLARSLTWTTNFTYMFQSKNKSTGERLSTIPEYTVNSSLSWQADERFSALATFTWYGTQKPQKYDYYGNPVTGSAADEVDPYVLLGVSGTYRVNRSLRLTAGIDNLLDKRLFRRGNAAGVNVGTPNEIAGAGAYTYNQPGRTFYVSMTASF